MKKTYSRVTRPLVLFQENLPEEYLHSCRLCLCQLENLSNIFSEDNILPTSTKIKFCTGLEISEDDGLPDLICEKCFNHLFEFYAFKKLCIATDAKLRQYTRTSKQNLVRQTCNVSSSKSSYINEECSKEIDKPISLQGETSDFENSRVSCLLEEDNIHPDAPEDVICQIKKEYEDVNKACVSISNGSSFVAEESPNKNDLLITLDCESTDFDNSGLSCILEVENLHPDVQEDAICQIKKEFEDEEFKASTSLLEGRTLPEKSLKNRPQVTLNNVQSEVESFEQSRFDCSHCWMSFISRQSIEKHMYRHIGERKFHCKKCGKKFLQKETLVKHVRKHTTDGGGMHSCSYCPRVLLTPEGLRCHIATHHAPRHSHRYKCKNCAKTFCHSSGLSRHLLSHSGIFYSCQICYKILSDGSSLKRHRLKKHPECRENFTHD